MSILSIFGIGSCPHKHEWLAVEKEHTSMPMINYKNYKIITYHLWCTRCNSPLKIEHATYEAQS